MQSQLLPPLQVYGSFLASEGHESASPECGSIAFSLDEACSSGYNFLLCTEEALDDCDMGDGDAFGVELLEFPANYRVDAGRRLRLPQIVKCANDLCIGNSMREDLRKQSKARWHAAAAENCPLAGCGEQQPAHNTVSGSSGFGAGRPRCCLPPSHRARMVGWMREVSEALRLHLSTFFAATSILDRFVAAVQALPPDGLLQLLALTCMSVAVKYNEVQSVGPTLWLSLAVDDLGRSLYEARDLQRFEFTVLQTIDWRLHEPTTYTFLEQFYACLPRAAAPAPAAATPDIPRRPVMSYSSSYQDTHAYSANRPPCAAATSYATAPAPAAAAAMDLGPSPFGPAAAGTPTAVPYTFHGVLSYTTLSGSTPAPSLNSCPAEPPSRQLSARPARTAAAAECLSAAPTPAAATAAAGLAGTPASIPYFPSGPTTAMQGALDSVSDCLAYWPVLERAAAFAETSLMFTAFLSYEYSTVAMACLLLAERTTFGLSCCYGGGGGGCSSGGGHRDDVWAFAGRAAASVTAPLEATAAAVAAAAELPLPLLAPGLDACISTLEHCCGLLQARRDQP